MGPDLTGPRTRRGGEQRRRPRHPSGHSSARRRSSARRSAACRRLTARPFGVNLLLHFPVEDQVAICLEERVPVLSLFWGDPTPYVGRALRCSGREGLPSGRLGRGCPPGGGRGRGCHHRARASRRAATWPEEVSTLALVPRVVDAIAPRPVVAAGGIADARWRGCRPGVGRAGGNARVPSVSGQPLRFSVPIPTYKQRLLEADEGVRSEPFCSATASKPNAPHRTLRTAFVGAMARAGGPRSRIAPG